MPTTVTLTTGEPLMALQAMVRNLAADISAVQWAALIDRPSDVYRDIAADIPAKQALVRKLTTGVHLDDTYVDGMIRIATRDDHDGRCARLTQRYDIAAAMAIDPASILAKAGAA